MKAVFTHKASSRYDDLPEERYHFPATYLRQVQATVGDHVIYYEPGRTGQGDGARHGRRSYVAVAQVVGIQPDALASGHFYAVIDPTSYLAFDRAVPFVEGSSYYEAGLRRADGATSKGAFGRAVRPLDERAFELILAAGFARELASEMPGAGLPGEAAELREEGLPFVRPIVERLAARPLRDAAFARAIQDAYGQTCAMTGLKIVNGGGRAEVEAAHIRAVADGGPDSPRNGLALSRTVHWMFDRGLVSVGPPPLYPILVSERAMIPEATRRLLNPNGRLRVPEALPMQPAAAYLEWHRAQTFKA